MFIKLFMLMLAVTGALSAVRPENHVAATEARTTTGDLATAETSAKLLNLFGTGTGYPSYGYNYNRPTTGYYPGYPNTNYYGNSNYYPGSGYGSSSFYPSQGYGSTNYYPSQGYYPSSGYYPTTNILGTQGGGYGGYGGYGGNGGFRQYSGYWQRDYQGQRNRGYAYYDDTDRYGLPLSRDRGYGSSSYRGYN
ncbi:keratin-associated protein 19-2 isoform X1 [Drosophila kikkawai]|uniref:Keratin-associated protein 19-2 isoform X1 n=1 Tax=Drosophila kikkawai TaxID=30033 RepID=A0ABM4GH79_DROKI|nr:prisilkin-39 isoform X1 [Drosophila kikkawai]